MTKITGIMAWTQHIQNQFLPDTCIVSRPNRVPDGMGGFTDGPPTEATYPCRLASGGIPDQYLAAESVLGRQVWMLTLPAGTDIRSGDDVEVNGAPMQVQGLASGGEMETAVRAVCVEVV